MDTEAWGIAYDSSFIKIRVSPDKTRLFFELKQQGGQSDHEKMIHGILEALIQYQILSLNVDHIRWAGKHKEISLAIDNVRVDFAIFFKNEMIHLEVKSEREALLDSTYTQVETVRRKQRIVGLVVPASCFDAVDKALRFRRLYNKVFPVVYEHLIEDPAKELTNLISLAQ